MLQLRAIALAQMKNYPEALQDYEAILRLNPRDTTVMKVTYSSMGDLYHQMDDSKNSYKCYEKALKIYLMIGRYLANATKWYHEFYDFQNLMILGRVTSGLGGSIILETAKMGLEAIDPALAEQVEIFMPDEKARRLGQSVAAAQIPEIK